MKSKNNFLVKTAAGAAFAACLLGGAATLNLNANAEEQAAANDFQMVYGASVRTKADETGIRFTATLSAEKYAEVSADENKKFGMIIVPEDYLTDATDTDDDGTANYVEHLKANHTGTVNGEEGVPLGLIEDLTAYSYNVDNSADGSQEICISGAVTNIQFKNMNRDFVGIAFIETATAGEGGAITYTYEYAKAPAGEADYCRRNITYVASAAYAGADTEDIQKYGDVMKGFVQSGIKQAAGLTAEDAMPDVTVTLDKTEIAYLSNTAVTVQYKVNGEAIDIDLYSALSAGTSVKVLEGNVLAPAAISGATPEKVAEATATVNISVPVLSDTATAQTLAIKSGYDSVAWDTFAVKSTEEFDMAAYLAGKNLTLQLGHVYKEFWFYNDEKPHTIYHTDGKFTLTNGKLTALQNKTTDVAVMSDTALGQKIHTVTATVAGANGNTLDVASGSIAFFDLTTVLEKGLVATNDGGYTIVQANGGYKWNGYQSPTIVTESDLPFKWGDTSGTFIKVPCHFDWAVYMIFPSQYDKSVLLWLDANDYQLEITAVIKHDTYTGSNLSVYQPCLSSFINMRTDGGWQSTKVSLAEFAAVTAGTPSESNYHIRLSRDERVGGGDTNGDIVGYIYMQIPKFVKKTTEA